MRESGEPVSAEALTSHLRKVKHELDKAMELEKGHLSQFEVCLYPLVMLVLIVFVLMLLGLLLWDQGFNCSGIHLIC